MNKLSKQISVLLPIGSSGLSSTLAFATGKGAIWLRILLLSMLTGGYANANDVEFTSKFVVVDAASIGFKQERNCELPQRTFQIGVYEITNTEYANFLNSVASKADPKGLWSPMHEKHFWGGIHRISRNDQYLYAVKAGYENLPVTFVSWYDTLRYINWLHYGRPTTGTSMLGTTEGNATVGAYDTSSPKPVRRPEARYFLPSCGEWKTAAFYDSNSRKFTRYSGGDLAPKSAAPTASGRVANFYADGWAIGYPHLAKVQDYASTPSAYGTVSQTGNVMEWTETISDAGPHRLALGGSLMLPLDAMSSDYRDSEEPHRKLSTFGFRVARQANVDEVLKFRATLVGSSDLVLGSKRDAKIVDPRWIRIGHPGNFPDYRNGRGCVSVEYEIASTEITNAQFADFLNAVAKSDANSLYIRDMTTGVVGGIDRQGSDGAFVYRAKPHFENRAASYISWFTLARYANWLHFGMPTGTQEIGTTEGDASLGAYDTRNFEAFGAARFDGVVRSDLFRRNIGAKYFIPTDDEWYKAAYYDPQRSGFMKFWSYPNRSDVPANANFQQYDSLAEGPPYYVSEVGTYGGMGFYGVSDMGGNLWEWTEDWRGLGGESCWRCNLPTKGLRGGSFNYVEIGLHYANIDPGFPSDHYFVYGGRVGRSIPDARSSWCVPRKIWTAKEKMKTAASPYLYFAVGALIIVLTVIGMKRIN